MNNQSPSSERKNEANIGKEKLLSYRVPKPDLNPAERKELEAYYNLLPEQKKIKKGEIDKKYKSRMEKYQRELDLELIKAPKPSIFRGFEKNEPNEGIDFFNKKFEQEKNSVISQEDIRILVGRILAGRPRLKAFFEKYCILEFNPKKEANSPDPKGGAVITQTEEKGEKKYKIEVDEASFFSELSTIDKQTNKKISIKYLDPTKFAFIIGETISQLIPPSEKIVEALNKNKIKEKINHNSIDNWTEFVSLCILDPDKAKEMNSEAFLLVEGLLEDFDTRPKVINGKITIEDPRINYNFIYSEKPKSERKRSFMDRIWDKIGYQIVIRRGTDWAERAKAEYDQKEMNRITAREEGIVQRDKRLEELIRFKDKNNCRRLILADSATGDIARWRLLLYAWTFDPIFRATKGERISEETFDLFQRCRRISESKRRIGTKPMDYQQDPETGEYVRVNSKEYQKEVDEEWAKKTDRESQGTIQETFEHMKVRNKFVGLDERLGDNLSNPDSDGWYVSTGDLRQILGSDNAAKFLKDIKSYAQEQGDDNWLSKLEPDQRAAIARFHITATKGSAAGPTGSPAARESNLYGEHVKPITREAFLFYEHDIPPLEESTVREAKELLETLGQNEPEKLINNASQAEIYKIFNGVKEPSKKESKKGKSPRNISLENIERLLRKTNSSNLPDEAKLLLSMGINNLQKEVVNDKPKESIHVQIDKLKNDLDMVLKDNPSNQILAYQIMGEIFKELANLKIIQDYSKIFSPYKKAVDNLNVEKPLGEKDKEKLEKFIKEFVDKQNKDEISPGEIKEAVEEYNKIADEFGRGINSDELEKILEASQKIYKFYDMANNKIEAKTESLIDILEEKNSELSNLYQKIERLKLEHPEELKNKFKNLLEEFKNMKILPENLEINNYQELERRLEILYAIITSRISEEIGEKQNKKDK